MKYLEVPQSWYPKNLKNIASISLNQRLNNLKKESFMMWLDTANHYHFGKRRANPEEDNVIAVLKKLESVSNIKDKFDYIDTFMYTHNLVTDDGEIYYAKAGVKETFPANEDYLDTTGRFEMGTTGYVEAETDTFNEFDVAGTSKISGSRKAQAATYPKSDDSDANNTGRAIDAASTKVEYLAADWNDTDVEQGCIHENATPVPATKLLCVWSHASFAKGTTDPLDIFVNHAMENQ